MTPTRRRPTADDATTDHAPATSARTIVATGAVAGLVAAAATVLTGAAARAIDIPMQAAAAADEAALDIPLWAFAQLTAASAVVGTLLALASRRWARRPARAFVAVTTVLTVVSFVGPVTAHHATTATRVVLELTHVIAAAIIIPALATRLGRR
jgi:hypothetical protein